MKKFLGMLAIAVAMVACNNDASSADAAADSTRIADSTRRANDSIAALTPVTPPVMDSTTMGDTSMMKKDSAK